MPEIGYRPQAGDGGHLLVSEEEVPLRVLLERVFSLDDIRHAEQQVFTQSRPGLPWYSDEGGCYVGHLIRRSVLRAGGIWEDAKMPAPYVAVGYVPQKPYTAPFSRAALAGVLEYLMDLHDDGRLRDRRAQAEELRRIAIVRTRRTIDGDYKTVEIEGVR